MPKSRQLFTILLLSMLSPLFNGCGLTIPNAKVCVVAGTMSAGTDCIGILAKNQSEMTLMTLDETIKFIEPQGDIVEPGTGKITKGHGAAIMLSSEDWNKIETVMEQACQKVSCNYEVTSKLETIKTNISNLQSKK